MGYRIIDQTSQGNAMSAYGTARGFRLNVPLLALVAGSLVLVAALIFLFLRMPVPLPEHTVFLIAARPAVLNKAVAPALQRDLPAPWRAAIDTHSHVPALFGVALDNNRDAHTFAVMPRTAFLGDMPGLSRQTRGLYHFLSVDPLPIHAASLQELRLGIQRTFGSEATFLLRGDLLEAWAFAIPFEENPDAVVRGVWNDGVGHLAFRDFAKVPTTEIDSPLFFVVNQTDDAHNALVAGLLSQGIDLRRASVLPYFLSLTTTPLGSRALTLMWADALSERDRVLLPEGAETSDADRMTLVRIATTTDEDLAPLRPSSCPGDPRFILEDTLLTQTLDALGVPPSWQNLLNTVRIQQTDSEALLCIE